MGCSMLLFSSCLYISLCYRPSPNPRSYRLPHPHSCNGAKKDIEKDLYFIFLNWCIFCATFFICNCAILIQPSLSLSVILQQNELSYNSNNHALSKPLSHNAFFSIPQKLFKSAILKCLI